MKGKHFRDITHFAIKSDFIIRKNWKQLSLQKDKNFTKIDGKEDKDIYSWPFYANKIKVYNYWVVHENFKCPLLLIYSIPCILNFTKPSLLTLLNSRLLKDNRTLKETL